MGLTPAQLWETAGPEQLDLMIASLEVEKDYGPHGQPLDEATDPRADPNYYGDDGFRYVAHHSVDFAQRAINDDLKELRSKLGADVDLTDLRGWVERVDY